MTVNFFCPMWGSSHFDLRLFLEKVKQSGYDGVEMSLPEDRDAKKEIVALLRQYDLHLIGQHWETLTPDFSLHTREYRTRLINLATAGPLFINSQTGKDYFSYEQNVELIGIAGDISKEYGVRIIHETHRGKFSFAAHITAVYLESIPSLRLGLDLSHWVNVAESWLEDQTEALNLALSRTDHIHARVGHPEGPQVTDPGAPEWKEALDKHTYWWRQVIEMNRIMGRNEFTVTPEFGPVPYMITIPYSGQPVANQWDINVFMMQHLKAEIC